MSITNNQKMEIVKPLYIFDLDDTLSLTDHRKHFIEKDGGKDKKRWRDYFMACEGDTPNQPVIETLKGLKSSGAEIRIWSGRMEFVRPQTERWLIKHAGMSLEEIRLNGALVMRPDEDWTADNFLKVKWLKSMNEFDRSRLVAAFDDRDRVVDAFRMQGVACFQVTYGRF